MPTRHRTFAREEKYPSYFVNAFQDVLVGLADNFVVNKLNDTTIRVPAAAGNDRACIVVNGLFRFREANTDRAVAGSAGTYAAFAVAKNNSVSNIPVSDTDATDYAFDLRVVLNGTTPTIVGGTVDVFRKVALVEWDGAAITRITQLVPAAPKHASTHAVGGSDPLTIADLGGAVDSDLSAEVAARILGDSPYASARVVTWNSDTNLRRVAAGIVGIASIARVEGALAAAPRVQWHATDAAANRGKWQMYAHSTGLTLTALADNDTDEYSVMGFGGRSAGTTVTSVTFFAGGATPTTITSGGAITAPGDVSAGKLTAYSSATAAGATSTGTNWLRSAKNTPTVQIGDNDSTTGYATTDYSGAIRFNGSGVAYGDIAYYPKATDGQFKLWASPSTVGTTKADLAIAKLFTSLEVLGSTEITARNTAATQVRIGAVGPASEAGMVFGSAADAFVFRVAAGIVGIGQVARVSGTIATNPRFQWRATDAATDRGRWQFYVTASGLSLTAQNDAENAEYGVLGFGGRTAGTTVGSATFFSGGSFPTTISNAGLLTITGNINRPLVTVLPTTGLTDGMEVLLQTATMATAGIPPFLLRYRAGAGTYKWEHMGAGMIHKKWRGISAGSATTTYAALTYSSGESPAGGVYSINLPVAGIWFVRFGRQETEPSSGTPSQESWLLATFSSGDPRSAGEKDFDAIHGQWTQPGYETVRQPAATEGFVEATTAGKDLTLMQRNGVTVAWPVREPWMSATPVAVI